MTSTEDKFDGSEDADYVPPASVIKGTKRRRKDDAEVAPPAKRARKSNRTDYSTLATNVTCDCGEHFTLVQPLLDHVFSCGVTVLLDEITEQYVCPHEKCQFTNVLDSAMKFHLLQHKKLKPFICDCSAAFENGTKLMDHINKLACTPAKPKPVENPAKEKVKPKPVENLAKAKGTKVKRHKCGICRRVFDTEKELDAHETKKHAGALENMMWTCHICMKVLTTENGYRYHLERHSGTKYPCVSCKITYLSRSALNRHNRENPQLHS
ncbi:Hypothetical protein POVN_LOCUS685 [uncultured virus]|nr:Hypothetical protein POVN_LOCUS685 [uncultured virus]